MLHAFFPVSSVFASVRVSVGTLSMLFVKSVISFILAAVLPNVVSISVHYTVLKHAFKISPIRPLKCTKSTHLVIYPLSRIFTSICPEVNTFTLFDSFLEIAMIVATITPYFDSFAILFLRRRCSTSLATLIYCWLPENAKVCCLVLLPVTFVNFISRCTEHTDSTNLSIDPVPFESAHIWPDKFSISTLIDLIVDSWVVPIVRIITLLQPVLLIAINVRDITRLVNCHESHLTHVLETSKFNSLDIKFRIFQAKACSRIKILIGVTYTYAHSLLLFYQFCGEGSMLALGYGRSTFLILQHQLRSLSFPPTFRATSHL